MADIVPIDSSSLLSTSRRRKLQSVVSAKVEGKSLLEIAEEFGLHTALDAQALVDTAYRELYTEDQEAARKLDLARADRMLKPLWEKIDKGDIPSSKMALSILEYRAKMKGLYAPPGGGEGTPQERLAKLFGVPVESLRTKTLGKLTFELTQVKGQVDYDKQNAPAPATSPVDEAIEIEPTDA